MGAGASTLSAEDASTWSKEEVAAQVCALGEAYEQYKDIALKNGIDGQQLLDLDDEDLEDFGVTMRPHRKNICKKLHSIKAGAPQSAQCQPVEVTATKVVPTATDPGQKAQLFMSYPRGDQTTPFAHKLKKFFEDRGFAVWMDVEGIEGGANFMSSIGSAIKASRGILAVIDAKFCGSTYCNNELAMAQGNNVQLFPILFRGLRFDQMPDGLQYMLASTNVVPFADEASDAAGMEKLHAHVCSILQTAPPAKSIRHCDHAATEMVDDAGAAAADEDNAGAAAADELPVRKALASIPITVPDPPDIVCERGDALGGMMSSLLGFLGTGSVSLSSVKHAKSKLSSHGSGGVGKTTLAAILVRHDMVRRSFDRIGWVSVGQAPDVLELQRVLYAQLTGTDMEAKPGASPEVQLQALQEASKGKRWLVVLDDVWDAKHEKLLNCVDVKTQSKLFVTTRIRGLLKGCDEISLELLTRGEAVDLLLRMGGIDVTEEARAAADRVAELCGDLPLFVGICGGIIADYEGAPEWQSELIEMLQEDRLMVMGAIEDEEGETVHRVVGTSLAMLKNNAAALLLQLLSLCPEDVPIPMDAALLIWTVCQPEQAKKVNVLTLRKMCKLLLDRNLLMGSTSDGVCMHDIVRDFMRSKFDSTSSIRAEQRRIVQRIIATTPDADWQSSTALGTYVRQSLRQHMVEAMPDVDPHNDDTVLSWLRASEFVTTSLVVRTAAEVCGPEVLEAMSAAHEAQGEFLQAGLRLVSAAHTSTRYYEYVSVDSDADHAGRNISSTRTLLHASDLLERAGDVSEAVRTLHVNFGSKLLLDNNADADLRGALQPRLVAMFEAGIAPATAHEAMKLGNAVGGIFAADIGGASAGAGASLDAAGIIELLRGPGKAILKSAQLGHELAVRDGLDGATRAAILATAHWPPGMSWCGLMATELPDHLAWYTYERHKEMVEAWDYPTSHMLAVQTIGQDHMIAVSPDVLNLLRFGDIVLAQNFVRRMASAFEVTDVASVPSLAVGFAFALAHASSFFAELETHDASLSLLNAFGCGFDTASTTVQAICTALGSVGFAWTTQTDKGWFGMFGTDFPASYAAIAKTAHWLHAPEKVDCEKRSAFLDVHAKAVSGSNFVHHDVMFDLASSMLPADVVRAMESLERYEEGATEAQRVLKWYPHNPTHVVEAKRAMGRCQAKLGLTEQSEASFQDAIAEAERAARPYHEMLARCDYIQAVLDPAGRREEQMAPLGRAIRALVLEPCEYDDMLGKYGLESSAAVAACEALAENST